MPQLKVLQYGEGNFLRGFADWMIDAANRAGVTDIGVAICKPIEYGSLDALKAQDCAYNVVLKGIVDGKASENLQTVKSVVSCADCYAEYDKYAAYARESVLRFVISNTTEAGITYDDSDRLSMAPPKSFPGKLTKLLYERYIAFNGDMDKGLIMLPVELIDDNGKKLKECVFKLASLWELPEGFIAWLDSACLFCSTLVDRIVTGYPATDAFKYWERLGYEDKLIVAGEPFALWVIESDKPELVQAEFPLDKAGNPVIFTDNMRPYRERKVRVLNGAHTGTVPAAYLAGLDTVSECVNDPVIRAYMDKLVYDEIAPTVPLPPDEVKAFADAVMERFANPYIRHELMSIALNSVSKWKARILPSLLDSYNRNGKLPRLLTFSFAALLAFYRDGKLTADGSLALQRAEGPYTVRDDKAVTEFFAGCFGMGSGEYVKAVAGNAAFWGMDLGTLDSFNEMVEGYLNDIKEKGMREAVKMMVEA
ncbi:MAG: tagaturonate reductase [Clostridiales bacterium]|jgi:tagaturonate reductase|nr:tagaturonate reductase [Clostridiales bacterium]